MLHNATPCYNSPRVTTKHTTTHKTVYPNAQKLSVITLKCILQIVMITAKRKIWHLNVNFIAKISLYFEARCVLFVSADLRGPKHTNMSIFRFLLISFFKSNYVLDKTVYYNIEKHFLKRFENRK